MTEDDSFAPRPVAGWFLPAAVASLLFMALGCVMYLMQVMTDPASLPVDRRAAYDAQPAWVIGAMAVSVWAGALGSAMLVGRKKWAVPLLAVSLVAVLVWLAGLLLVRDLRENMSANDLIVALVVTALTWTIYWFARHSSQRGWLNGSGASAQGPAGPR
jgi:hypothetical protein